MYVGWRVSVCEARARAPCFTQARDAYMKDSVGEATEDARYDQDKCLVTRKQQWDAYCGVEDTMMYFSKGILPLPVGRTLCRLQHVNTP